MSDPPADRAIGDDPDDLVPAADPLLRCDGPDRAVRVLDWHTPDIPLQNRANSPRRDRPQRLPPDTVDGVEQLAVQGFRIECVLGVELRRQLLDRELSSW